ncbi:hypothetical protein P692DRAFT_20953361 [Suillus brevipes Sb2]|nr:hypothetical protein P692DRAFT_20953361 [Suillus brevipes Sb2]
MNRGFLKTQKAKRRVAKAVDSESAKGPPSKKSKDDDTKAERLDATSRAEYADFSAINPHKLPKSVQDQCDNDERCVGYGKNRIIFRVWPRDPKGQAIKPSPLRGKEAGNGLDLWGATLYDFYHVRRLPNVPNYITNSTGSRLAKWMRQVGELTAKDELYWADKEENPKEIPVADIGELISCFDTRVRLGIFNQYSCRKEIREQAKSGWSGSSYIAEVTDVAEATDGGDQIPPVGDQDDKTSIDQKEEAVQVANEDAEGAATANVQLNEAMQVCETGETSPEKGADKPTDKPFAPLPNIDSPFHPDHYPSPHPFIPCTHDGSPILQQRIPLHLLPKKLHVHDPWNKLSIHNGDTDHQTPWLSKVASRRDIVRTYSLSLAPGGKEAALKTQKLDEIQEDEATKEEGVMRIFPSNKEGPTEEPLIEVTLPPRPRRSTQVEEAHLYISPPAVGSGNHSVVYSVEWELPRDLFIDARLCRACVELDARQQIQKLKDDGKWEALLNNPKGKPEETLQAGPDVASGTESSQASDSKRTVGHVTIEEIKVPEVTASFISPDDELLDKPSDEKSADANDAEPAPTSDGVPHVDSSSDSAQTGGTKTDVEMNTGDGQDLEPEAKVDKEEPPDVEMKVDETQYSGELNALGSAPREDKGKGKEEQEQDHGDEEQPDANENEEGDEDEHSEEEHSEEEHSKEEIFTVEPARVVRVASYSGPALRIRTNVKWRAPWELCGHGSSVSGTVPRTATVLVAAKLSIEHDLHLAREANNYQSFPDHFFQHWNGYNVMPPLHDPVPVGALCPQFYGYYTPDDPTDGTSHPNYLSPILLLEHCGREINPDELCIDDKQECASLVFRFHHAGWLHESFAARNVLWQQGKPTEWPIQRPYSTKSFRLIDFGRSRKLDSSLTRASEEDTALRLLHLLHHAD